MLAKRADPRRTPVLSPSLDALSNSSMADQRKTDKGSEPSSTHCRFTASSSRGGISSPVTCASSLTKIRRYNSWETPERRDPGRFQRCGKTPRAGAHYDGATRKCRTATAPALLLRRSNRASSSGALGKEASRVILSRRSDRILSETQSEDADCRPPRARGAFWIAGFGACVDTVFPKRRRRRRT